MGTPVPPDMPILKDAKMYRIGIDWYQDVTPANDCSQKYQGRFECCRTGLQIKNWRNALLECVGGAEICPATGFSAQRIVYTHGPYDDFDACQADL